MEAFDFAVGLGAARSGLFHFGVGGGTGAVPEPGLVAAAVVGDDPLTCRSRSTGTRLRLGSRTQRPWWLSRR